MQKVVFVNLYETSYLGTRLLASYLRANGHETHNLLYEEKHYALTDDPIAGEIEGYHMYMNGNVYEQLRTEGALPADGRASLAQGIRLEKPDVIGFSTRSTHNYLATELAALFRKTAPEALLVAGGYGPTLNPEIYLDAGFDVVVRGDGEEALLELVNAWEQRDRAALVTVPGTAWASKWGGARNLLRDQKKDLSWYPAPLSGNEFFSYIENGELRRHLDPVLSGRTYFTFFGRGCIGTCSYCSGGNWSRMYREEGKKAYKRRNRAIDDVIHELASLPANIDTIIFADEYWGNARDKTKEFFRKYRDQVHRNFFAYLDYEQIVTDAGLFDLVLDAGLMATGIGFQTGSREFALKYYRRKQNFPLLVDYCHKLFYNKVHVNPQFIGGNCYETWDDFMQSVALVRKLPFSIETPFNVQLQSTQLKPHPKSPLREIAPRVVTDPMPTREWYYRAILLELARLLDEEAFNALLEIGHYREDPKELQKAFRALLFKKQYAHFSELIATRERTPWYFYGTGEAYQKNKDFFAPLKPRAILLDRNYIGDTRRLDALPVMTPEELFEHAGAPADAHFMVFSHDPWRLEKKLLRTWKVPFAHIHACASGWASPFDPGLIDEYKGVHYPGIC